jgi:apolipoprotein N-acyltransferase
MLYLAGLLHWLLLIQWIRLPHWTAWFGWLALAGYLAIYVPLFVALARNLVHRCGISSVLAAPIAWTAMEMVRSYLLSGFSMSLLGHTQLPWLDLVQIADVTGAYGVGFVVMLGAASLERLWRQSQRRAVRAWPLVATAAIIVGCVAYGQQRLAAESSATEQSLRVGLIQGSYDTQFDGDLERVQQAFWDYMRLSREAVTEHGEVDLLIWPESMFTGTAPMLTFDEPITHVPDWWDGSAEELTERLRERQGALRDRMRWATQQTRKPMLVGMAWDHLSQGAWTRFNSAVLIGTDGEVAGRYDKRHLVMFGEYVPLGNVFPWLYKATPMEGGLTSGSAPRTFEVSGMRLAPAICFENTVPHLIRQHVRTLARAGEDPDVLVTVTNDGWFWGSSLLDVHLACGVFRAIELRRPHVIAANTGFSASIDGSGRVVAQGPRRAAQVVVDRVQPDGRRSLYLAAGDWFAGGCLLVTLGGVFQSVITRRRAFQENPVS